MHTLWHWRIRYLIILWFQLHFCRHHTGWQAGLKKQHRRREQCASWQDVSSGFWRRAVSHIQGSAAPSTSPWQLRGKIQQVWGAGRGSDRRTGGHNRRGRGINGRTIGSIRRGRGLNRRVWRSNRRTRGTNGWGRALLRRDVALGSWAVMPLNVTAVVTPSNNAFVATLTVIMGFIMAAVVTFIHFVTWNEQSRNVNYSILVSNKLQYKSYCNSLRLHLLRKGTNEIYKKKNLHPWTTVHVKWFWRCPTASCAALNCTLSVGQRGQW